MLKKKCWPPSAYKHNTETSVVPWLTNTALGRKGLRNHRAGGMPPFWVLEKNFAKIPTFNQVTGGGVSLQHAQEEEEEEEFWSQANLI